MKKFTFLMSMLLCAVASVWAGPTDLPQITEDVNNPIYYTISNTRSEGKVMYYTAEGVRDENPQVLTDAHKFFFTGSSLEDLKIHNAEAEKYGLLFDGSGKWTEEGTSCKISVTPHSSKAGLAIEYKGTSLNEHNQGRNTYCEYGANDEGSIYVMDLVAAWPEAGKLYVIEAPLFEASTGVAKGIYAKEDGYAAWKATDLIDKKHIWTVEYSAEKGYAIKNYATGMYLSHHETEDRFIVGASESKPLTLKFLGQGQFNIISGGNSMHAGQHGGGSGAGSYLCKWDGGIGSASAWKFVECQDPDAVTEVEITYNFTYNDEVKYTQTTITIVGNDYPNITQAFPFGITATKPEGKVTADATTINIPLVWNGPFEYASSYDAIEKWYYVKLKGANYLYHVDGKDHIALDQATVPAVGKDAYSWAFVGNPFDGFQIVNMAAGKGYILSSTTNITNDANTFPVMTATSVPDGNNELWVLTASTHQPNGFYMEQKGHSNNKMNNRNNKLAYWTGGADNGSTFTVELRLAAGYYTFSNGSYYITSDVTEGGRIACSTTNDAKAIYYFDGEHLLAYTTGLYFGLNANDWTFEAVGSKDISKIEFVAAANGAARKFNIKSGGRWLHRTDGYVNRCSSNTCGDAHNWTIEEVTSLPVTITDAGYASFYAPVALEIPSGVKAYYIGSVNGGYAQMEEIEGVIPANTGVIPANTGVILEGNEGLHNFKVVGNVDPISGNLLEGSDARVELNDKDDDFVYVLGYDENDENLGLYRAPDQGNNGIFINGSHKAYLPSKALDSAQLSAGFTFDFSGTTGIDEVKSEAANTVVEGIFDLMGRRVENPTRGIYIVNGKRVFIK